MTPPLIGLSSMATRRVLADLAQAYRQATGIPVDIQPVGGVDAARRVRAGEPLDLVVLAEAAMAQLEAEGHLVAGSSSVVARSGISVAVPAGRPRPPLADEGAVRRAVLAADAICYSTGPSGAHLKHLLERWGLDAAAMPKAIVAPPGVPVAAILTRGEADLGFQQLSELLHEPGIEVLGPLPSSIQVMTGFVAAVASLSQHKKEAAAFIRFANSGDADAVKRAGGMEPAAPT